MLEQALHFQRPVPPFDSFQWHGSAHAMRGALPRGGRGDYNRVSVFGLWQHSVLRPMLRLVEVPATHQVNLDGDDTQSCVVRWPR